MSITGACGPPNEQHCPAGLSSGSLRRRAGTRPGGRWRAQCLQWGVGWGGGGMTSKARKSQDRQVLESGQADGTGLCVGAWVLRWDGQLSPGQACRTKQAGQQCMDTRSAHRCLQAWGWSPTAQSKSQPAGKAGKGKARPARLVCSLVTSERLASWQHVSAASAAVVQAVYEGQGNSAEGSQISGPAPPAVGRHTLSQMPLQQRGWRQCCTGR